MNVTTSTSNGFWEYSPCTVVCHADREIWTIVYEGFWDTLKDEFGQYQIGDRIDRDDLGGLGDYQEYMFVSNISMQRKNAGLGEVRISYLLLYKREIWNLDFSEVSKNIKNWLVLQYTTWSGGVATVNSACYEELEKIKEWEHQRDIGAYEAWGNFLYNGKDKLQGDTLKLAEKMMKGIDNYPVYSPCITRTTVWAFEPPVGEIGCRDTPQSRSGWSGFNKTTLSSDWVGLANVFLKTAERSSSNGDGTFTLVEQWIGADELDADLYPSA